MNVLVLQPIRPTNTPALRERADWLLARLEGANPSMTFDICQDDSAIPIPAHPSLYMRHATVRNYMLDKYLGPSHTHVLWVDSDLIDYPADLPTMLHEAGERVRRRCVSCGDEHSVRIAVDARDCPLCGDAWMDVGAIVAPMAVLDPSPARLAQIPGRERFYDVGGFIEKENRARLYPPWFEGRGDIIELDSVGCCYLAPASLYQAGVRYAPPPTDYYVEHWSVMQAAKRKGYRICTLTNVRAVHAWLPDYGLEAN